MVCILLGREGSSHTPADPRERECVRALIPLTLSLSLSPPSLVSLSNLSAKQVRLDVSRMTYNKERAWVAMLAAIGKGYDLLGPWTPTP